jgi:hypothetical protein
MTKTNILIQTGTIVQRDDGHLVTLRGIVCVDADRQQDGCYKYRVDGHDYMASAGTVSAINY